MEVKIPNSRAMNNCHKIFIHIDPTMWRHLLGDTYGGGIFESSRKDRYNPVHGGGNKTEIEILDVNE